MGDVKVSELRTHLPEYLRRVQRGEELRIVSRGRVIARIVPESDARDRAKSRLAELRESAWIGVVVSPIGVVWDAEK